MRSRLVGAIAAMLLIALPSFAADRSIQSGLDLWVTKGDGSTFIDFSKNPIPSGFFCFKSTPFRGKVAFQGVPVATGEARVLGKTDTIVQRLDEAVFDRNGVAWTRIQVRALQFESVKPIQTACGAFNVEVRLNGPQPITSMKIVRKNDHGGRFFAPIWVNGKVVFTPVGRRSGEILEMTRNVRFPANQGISWADREGGKVGKGAIETAGFVLADTDGDRAPDTYLPGTSSNFAAGVRYIPADGRTANLKQYIYDENGCHWEAAREEGHCPVAAQ